MARGVAGHVKPHYSFPILPSHTHTPTPTSPNSWDLNRNNFFLANSWVSISLVLILGANLGFDVPTSLRVDVCLVWCGFNISCWHRSRNPPSSLPQQIVSIQPLLRKAWTRIWLFFWRQNGQWYASQFCRGDKQSSAYWIIILGFIWCAFIISRRSGVVAICLLEDCENRGSTVNTYSSRISIVVDNNNFSIAVILAICLPVDCGLETAAKLRGPWLNSTDRIETCNTLRACWENFQTIIPNHVFSHIWYLMFVRWLWMWAGQKELGCVLTEQEFFKPFAHHPDFPTINQPGSVGGNYCQIWNRFLSC